MSKTDRAPDGSYLEEDDGLDDERPAHRPFAPDAPIPGVHHYSGCDPDHPTVGPDGICEGCGETACAVCGFGAPCECGALR